MLVLFLKVPEQKSYNFGEMPTEIFDSSQLEDKCHFSISAVYFRL